MAAAARSGPQARKKKVPSKAPARSAKKAPPKTPVKAVCFVMSPFGGWYDRYHDEIYCEAIKAAGLTPRRADDLYRPTAIVQDIWDLVKEAKVMLADLTDKNPNVMYELGLAHALAKPVVLVAQAIGDVPFDLRAMRVIVYDVAAPDWASVLRDQIAKALEETLKNPGAALQPFRHEVRSANTSVRDDKNADLRQLQREVNLLRSEVSRGGRLRRPHKIEPDEAEAMIDVYVQRKMPLDMIIDRLLPLGPPEGWIRSNVSAARKRIFGSAASGEPDE